MKKLLCLVFVGCSILFLTGCDQKANDSAKKDNTQNTASESTKTEEKIDMERAKKTAISDAGFGENEVTDLECELDNKDNKYEVSFKNGGKEYEYDIDVTNGNILKKEVKNDD